MTKHMVACPEEMGQGSVSRRAVLAGLGLAGTGVMFGRFFSTPAQAKGGALQVMAWEGYDTSKEAAEWLSANGLTIEPISIAVQDDVQAKFVAGNPPPIDLAEYNQAYADLYIREMKIAMPLDPAKIPNYSGDNLFSVFYEKPTWSADGKLWGVPYMWGFNTLLYNADLTAEPTSYADLLKPEFKGKIAIMDDTVSTWPVAARVAGLGEKYPLLTKDELGQAFAELGKYRDQARLIALNQGELLNMMSSGEVIAALCADPSILTQAKAENKNFKMTLPKEGPVLWVDAWFIPVSADNVEGAHTVINNALSPEVQAKVAMSVVQAPVSKKAVDLLDEESRARIDYSDVEGIFAAGLPGIPPRESADHATYDDWIQAWQEFKAGM